MSLKFGVIVDPPDSYPCSFTSSCNSPGRAFEASLLACQYLHFNCTFSIFDKFEFGDYDEDSGNVSGVIGGIYRGEFDTTVPELTPTYSRSQVLSFTSPVFYDDLVLVTRAPSKNGINWDVIYSFQNLLWLAMVISIFLNSILVTVNELDGNRVNCTSIITKCFTNALALITRQYKLIKQHTKAQIYLVTFWAISYIVLANSYTGALFSEKMTAGTKLPFTNLDTFADCILAGKCTMVAPSLSISSVQFLMTEENPVSLKLEKGFQRNPIVVHPVEQTPSIILQEHRKFLVWLIRRTQFSMYLKLNKDKTCSFHMITLPYNDNGAFVVRKNSTIFRRLNKFTEIIRQSGLYKKIESKYIMPENTLERCNKKRSTQDQIQVKFDEIATVFVFYSIGCIGAVIAFVIEVHCYWPRRTS